MSEKSIPWNLDKIKLPAPLPMPKGTRLEIGTELLRRAKENDARFELAAIESERDGDSEGTHFAMAARAHNKRFIDRLEKDLAELAAKPTTIPTDGNDL